MTLEHLPVSFFKNDALTVAPSLLGKRLVVSKGEVILSGMIVETEAYRGFDDASSHAYNGKTQRNSNMFEEGGIVYVYMIYGSYFCLNFVTGNKNDGQAVLIRGVEPLDGLDVMRFNRFGVFGKKPIDKNLTNGPGKICKAFGIDKSYNGESLSGTKIFITNEKKISKQSILSSSRRGITQGKEHLWRYYIHENKFVS